jgi:hypothetical protein
MIAFMYTTTSQQIDWALEKVRSMALPEDEDLFSLKIREKEGCWQVSGVVSPFAHRVEEGEPYPVMCLLPLYEVEFSSREEALDFTRKVNDILVKRGKEAEAFTSRLLGHIS